MRSAAIGFAALLLSTSVTALAQDNLTSTSGSDATANSGSVSGASSDNTNANTQGQQQNNAGIGNSVSGSASDSTANSGSVSGSESNGNTQGQSANNTQGQSANNSQGQGQDQGQAQQSENTNSLGQTASNEQGVVVNQTWNSPQRKHTEVWTNNAVPLAASSSFSSDYCGGTASGGLSAAPIGVSIGMAKPTFDESCQYLRRSEKFGMAAANYWNMQQPEEAGKLMSLMVWSICMADTRNDEPTPTQQACQQLLGSIPSAPPQVYRAPPEPSLPYVAPNADVAPEPNEDLYRTPRGDASDGIGEPLAAATLPFAASMPPRP